MVSQEQFTQTEQLQNPYRMYFGLTGKNILKFVSSLILPLMLGIFTVVVTFEQQKIARQQRLEDKNESQLQRKQEWDIAMKNYDVQNKVASDRYREEVLLAYIKEIGDLLKDNNGSLTFDPVIRILARVKTLNVFRQLDGPRRLHVIRFLYEAKQLTNTDTIGALDISTAELSDIDFDLFTPANVDLGVFISATKIEKISFAGVYLRNCTSRKLTLRNVNFSFAWLWHVQLSSATLNNVKFSSSESYNVNFSSAWLQNVNFSPARLQNVNFASTMLDDVNFSSARLQNVNFSSAWLRNVNFSSSDFYNVSFSSAKFDNVNFSSARFIDISGASNFHYTKMADTIFVKCDCNMVNFTGANLKHSSFHSARLTRTDFSLANLHNADFTNTAITDSQLQSALSIYNAKLPNGTFGQGRNLVKNGDANCNTSLVNYWHVQNGNIAVVLSKKDRSECHFTLQSIAAGAMMSQRIDLVRIWDSSIWTYSYVELQAHMSSGVSIELSGKASNGTVLTKHIARSDENKISMYLRTGMQELEVLVKFNAHNDKRDNDNIWCDDIELFVDYDW